jgi:hypothetical protein
MPVYMIQAGGEHGPVKIGVTDDVEKRLIGMQTGNHLRLAVMRLFEGGPVEERALHQRFDDLRLNGEWFSFSKAMLGDLGLVEVKDDVTLWVERLNEISARHTEVGNAVLEEMAPEERASLREMWRRYNMPVWQHFGLPDPGRVRRADSEDLA